METTIRHRRRLRMDEQDRVSQASSVATISSFPVKSKGDDRVQTFGKRCHAAKRDPNCLVVIRGWLFKKDSTGLRLWKRRWFVLSDFCLFYYKDSREESVMGSIPLPSYKILFCTPRECKNRKYAFKVVHQGMRSYVFSADTQEDMLGWVRALSQSACMATESSINRRCSSYQDFTQIGGSTESVDLPHSPSLRDNTTHSPAQFSRLQKEPSQLKGGRMGTPQMDRRGRRRTERQSPLHSLSQDGLEREPHPFLSIPQTPSSSTGSQPLTPRGHLGSRPHTPVGRVDIRPQEESPQTLTPSTERWHTLNKPSPPYSSPITTTRRTVGKGSSVGGHADQLPPLPPSRVTHAHHPPHHHHHHLRSHMSVCLLPPAMPSQFAMLQERVPQPISILESNADAVLTRLCGYDKLLQSLSIEVAQLQADKESVQCALEVRRLQLEEWNRGQEVPVSQNALLQEELVTIRARMCDVSMEMERVWSEYERMESELSVFRSHLQHVCHFGLPQEQSQAQRQLWMMEDILCGLKVNRNHFRVILGLQRPVVPSPVFQKSIFHPTPQPEGVESEPPARPPLPQELQETNQSRGVGHDWVEPGYETVYTGPVDPLRSATEQPYLHSERKQNNTHSDSLGASRWMVVDSAKKGKMSEEEQVERMKRNQERATNRKKVLVSAPLPPGQGHGSEATPFPLRVTRVTSAVLPHSLVARHVSVEDPPPELATPLPEQISPERPSHSRTPSKPRRLFFQLPDQNAAWFQAEASEEKPVQRLARALQEVAAEQRRLGEDPEAASTLPELRDPDVLENGSLTFNPSGEMVEGHASIFLNSDLEPDPCLTPEQREAKLRRVQRIRERVIRSAVRESSLESGRPLKLRPASMTLTNETPRRSWETADSGTLDCGSTCYHSDRSAHHSNGTVGPQSPWMMSRSDGARREYMGPVDSHSKPAKSASHISTLTAILGTNNEVQEPPQQGGPSANQHLDHSVYTNRRTEWFLSTNQWQEYTTLFSHGIDSVCCENSMEEERDEDAESRKPLSHTHTHSHPHTHLANQNPDHQSIYEPLIYTINQSNYAFSDSVSAANQNERAEQTTNETPVPCGSASGALSTVDSGNNHQLCHPSESFTCSDTAITMVTPSSITSQSEGEVRNISITSPNEEEVRDISIPNEQQDSRSAPPTQSANQTPCTLNQSALELRIYEEIPYKAVSLKAANEEQESPVGGAESPSAMCHMEPFLSNQSAALEPGGGDKAVDVMAAWEGQREKSVAMATTQPIYSSVFKEGAANPCPSYSQARVTVVRTSL